MAAKKKAKSKTKTKAKAKTKPKAKRAVPKPRSKANPAAKRIQPKAKIAPAAKKSKGRATAVVRPKPKPAREPDLVIPPSVAATPPVPLNIVRPGLQKRADTMPIGVVTVMDGERQIEQSTFYSVSGRDEYVERWKARGYTCELVPWTNS